MKKLALKLDDLQVTSFDTSAAAHGARGTVRGNGGNTLTNNDDGFTLACNSVVICQSQEGTCRGQMTCGGASCDGCTDWNCPTSPEQLTCLAYECN